jgi:hypothetical protein
MAGCSGCARDESAVPSFTGKTVFSKHSAIWMLPVPKVVQTTSFGGVGYAWEQGALISNDCTK